MGESFVTEDQRVPNRLRSVRKIRNEEDLCFAAQRGNDKVMAELLQTGISVEAKHFNLHFHLCMTPLHFAAERGHLQCVKLLIDCGANLNATNEFGFTAVHLAADRNHYECLKLLLEAGADCSLAIFIPFKYDYRVETPFVGTTALHLAATYRNAKCLEELMRYGADCDALDEKGRTGLYIAAESGSERSVVTLLRNIHGISCVSLPSFDSSDNPLHHAVRNKMVHGVKMLVRLGADVNHVNYRGVSPLHLLFVTYTERKYESDMKILKHLVLDSHNIDINKTTKEGKTALELGLLDSHPEILKFLITYGADINIKLHSSHIHSSPLCFFLLDSSDFDILKYLVNCMPQLPHLESLDVRFASNIVHEIRRILREELQNILMETPMVIDEQVIPEYNAANQPTPNLLQQPLLDGIYEVVIQKLEQIEHNRVHEGANGAVSSQISRDYNSLLRLKKQLWYERLASNPLTLQHCCRFSVRKSMGPSNLKHISKLPLPEKIKSYLLFKSDEEVEP